MGVWGFAPTNNGGVGACPHNGHTSRIDTTVEDVYTTVLDRVGTDSIVSCLYMYYIDKLILICHQFKLYFIKIPFL